MIICKGCKNYNDSLLFSAIIHQVHSLRKCYMLGSVLDMNIQHKFINVCVKGVETGVQITIMSHFSSYHMQSRMGGLSNTLGQG